MLELHVGYLQVGYLVSPELDKWTHTNIFCLQTIKKQCLKVYHVILVSVRYLCQGHLKISRENAKLPKYVLYLPSQNIN